VAGGYITLRRESNRNGGSWIAATRKGLEAIREIHDALVEAEADAEAFAALVGKRVRLFGSDTRAHLVVAEGIVELDSDREAIQGRGRREPHMLVRAPDGRCPFYVHASRRVEVLDQASLQGVQEAAQ
jgi:hypothetical protein